MIRRHDSPLVGGLILLTVVLIFVAACSGGAAPSPTIAPAPSPKPQVEATATPARIAQTVTPTPTKAAATPTSPQAPTPTAVPSSTPPVAKQPKYGGTLAVTSYIAPANFDLQQNTSVTVSGPMRQAYNTLVRLDDNTYSSIVPELASKWNVGSDGTVYTFELRSGVKWHDGQGFSADDAAFSIQREIDPSLGISSPRGSALLDTVKRIDALDATHLQITLKNPSAAFLSNLSSDWNVILPKHVIQAKGDMKTSIVGTGPFKLGQNIPGASISFVKNPDYFVPGRPYLDGVIMYIIPDAGTRLAAFRTRRVILGGVATGSINNLDDQKQLKNDFGGRVIIQPHASFSADMIHMNQRQAPWSDARVRRAVSLALNRQQAIDFGGQGGAIGGYEDPLGTWGLPQDEVQALPGFRAQKDADLAEAKRLMAEAGFGSGIQATMKASNLYTAQEMYQQQLKLIGIDLKLQALDTPLINKAMADGDFGILYFPQSQATEDPDVMIGSMFRTRSARNYTGFSDPAVDRALDAISAETDMGKRKQLVTQLDRKLLSSDPGEVVIYWRPFYRLWWSDLQNFKQGPGAFTGWVLENVWLETQS